MQSDRKTFETLADQALLLEARAGAVETQARAQLEVAAALRLQARELQVEAFKFDPEAEREERIRSCQGKKKYRSAEAAGQAASSIGERRDVNLRIYSCGFCDGFHFTKSDLAQYATRKVA